MHIHILGICGTAMAGFARIATQLGHHVTGADANVYPPMSEVLADLGIAVHQGYGAESLVPRPDLVLIGNALSRGNPAVEAVLSRGIPYTSGPEWLSRNVLTGRRVIALSGTHGKTTTTALVTHILKSAGYEPGYMVGGQVPDLGATADLGMGDWFVIEADEYDTAFFDKRSKFVHYRPNCLAINNLEFDHADIFADLSAIETQFHHLVRTVPANGVILANANAPAIDRVLARGCWTPVYRFAASASASTNAALRLAEASDPSTACMLHIDGCYLDAVAPQTVAIRTQLLGTFNQENIAVALGAALFAGVPLDKARAAVASFRGVIRRLQPIFSTPGLTVYDDFAHHPTAIAATLQGLRRAHPDARILVALEPRSNTMRMGLHRDALATSLAAADAAHMLIAPDLGWTPSLAAASLPVTLHAAIDDLERALLAEVAAHSGAPLHLVLMSNGGFGGLPQRLPATLATALDSAHTERRN